MSIGFNRKTLSPVATVLAVALCLFQIYFTGGFAAIEAPILRATHLGLVAALIFLWIPAVKRPPEEKEPLPWLLLDIALAALSLAMSLYIYQNVDAILSRIQYVDEVTQMDLFFGTATILIVLEITRRTSGMSLVVVSVLFMLYALFGNLLPGDLGHSPIPYDRLVEEEFLSTAGIFGVPLSVASGMIFAFVMFGAFLECTGMSAIFMDLACLLTKRSQGGPAKVAIFASALFGTISGSAPANVYGTGTFTIPLMKRVGYQPAFAGAVEAVASTGGQIMPPVMGAAAFIMADMIGMSYLKVATAALLPSLLYYLALLFMIHFEAVKYNLGYLPPEQVPDTRKVLMRLYYMLPIVMLIVTLMSGRSVISSAFVATLFIALLSFLHAETRLTPRRLVKALAHSARNALMVSAACACSGIIIGVITLTGIGYTFINAVTSLAGGSLFLLMVLLTVTCLILGMRVPTAPAYIIVATLGAPALVKFGVPPIAAHMFVFYYAILSVITPPVCIASYSGAAIAEASAMKTGFISVKLGIVAFIIPFMFVYEPSLLLMGDPLTIVLSTISSLVGVITLAGGMQGYLLANCRLWERISLLFAGLVLIYPGVITDLIGLALLILVCIAQWSRRKNNRQPVPSAR